MLFPNNDLDEFEHNRQYLDLPAIRPATSY